MLLLRFQADTERLKNYLKLYVGQIGIHNKPVGLLNIKGFMDQFCKWLNVREEGFMNPSNKELIVSAETADKLIHAIQNYERPVLGTKWKQLS